MKMFFFYCGIRCGGGGQVLVRLRRSEKPVDKKRQTKR